MPSTSQPLDYPAVRDAYQAKFNARPSRQVLKSVSLMQGTQTHSRRCRTRWTRGSRGISRLRESILRALGGRGEGAAVDFSGSGASPQRDRAPAGRAAGPATVDRARARHGRQLHSRDSEQQDRREAGPRCAGETVWPISGQPSAGHEYGAPRMSLVESVQCSHEPPAVLRLVHAGRSARPLGCLHKTAVLVDGMFSIPEF